MTKRQENMKKLIHIYNELYKIRGISLYFEVLFDHDNFDSIYKEKHELQHLKVLEPLYKYRLKEVMLGVTSPLTIYVAFDTTLIPYISLAATKEDFLIPKDWRNITISMGNGIKDGGNIYIKYANNISVNNTTNLLYDSTYALIHNIVETNKIIVSKSVYYKILKKLKAEIVYTELNGEDAYSLGNEKSFHNINSLKLNVIHSFIINYRDKYIPKNKQSKLNTNIRFMLSHPNDNKYIINCIRDIENIENIESNSR